MEAGRSYTLEFRAKADAPCTVRASASQAHEPWAVFDSKAIDLAREWKSFRFTFPYKGKRRECPNRFHVARLANGRV
jgi:hypothetical protein